MSEEVNVFMDPFLQIYTECSQIKVADGLVEAFLEEILHREQQKNTEGMESMPSRDSQQTECVEQPGKDKESNLPNRIESKLRHLKEREIQKAKREKDKEKHSLKIPENIVITSDGLLAEKCLEKKHNTTEPVTADEEREPVKKLETQTRKKKEQVSQPGNECLHDRAKQNETSKSVKVRNTEEPPSTQLCDAKSLFEEQQEAHNQDICLDEPCQEAKEPENIPDNLDQSKTTEIVSEETETKKSEEEHCNAKTQQKVKCQPEEPHETLNQHMFKDEPCEEKKLRSNSEELDQSETAKNMSLKSEGTVDGPSTERPGDKHHNAKTCQMLKTLNEHIFVSAPCQEAKKPERISEGLDQSEIKQHLPIKSEITESTESVKPPEEEHVYELPDVITTTLDNVTLHIGVTGSTGAGKSTFINAIRGLQPDEDDAAPTGVTETTMMPTMYPHPTMPNVRLWDLPGTGSAKFRAKNYLKEIKLETFDFFIIISSQRFKENDIMLAKAIRERKKLFYFLRSKIDNDVQAESQKRNFDEQKLLSQIREDCHKNLRPMDVSQVFLISSFQMSKYDFQSLIDTLEAQLPAHKRDALVLSLPIYSAKALEDKVEVFMKQTWSAAVASGSVSVAPVPGLSIACDAAILLSFFTKCYYAFGLDDASLDKLSVRVNNPSLKSVRKSPLVVALGQKQLSSKVLSALTSKEAAVKFAWSMVPVVGSKKTAKMSFGGTLRLLREGLTDLADTARDVLKAAGLTNVY